MALLLDLYDLKEGEQLMLMRRRYRRSQQELADAAGVTQAYVCMVERGKRSPSAITMLVDALLQIGPKAAPDA